MDGAAIITAIGGFIVAVTAMYTAMSKAAESNRWIKKLEERIDELEDERDALKEWAERLIEQVVESGKMPVKMRPLRKRKKAGE